METKKMFFTTIMVLLSSLNLSAQMIFGVMDKNGNVTIPPIYDECSGPDEGFYNVKMKDGFIFMDSTGKKLNEKGYEGTTGFSEGLAGVLTRETGFYGFINKKNELVIRPRYEEEIGRASCRERV